jgi:hypothetical protein
MVRNPPKTRDTRVIQIPQKTQPTIAVDRRQIPQKTQPTIAVDRRRTCRKGVLRQTTPALCSSGTPRTAFMMTLPP